MIHLRTTDRQPRLVAAVAASTLALFGAGVLPAAAAPTLSKKQIHSLKQACGYFSSDYAGLVGELKMSNLTGKDLRSAARYVAGDLKAVSPTLGAADRHQLALARKILAQVAATTPKKPVSNSEKNRLGKTFGAAPFASLSSTVRTACEYLKSR